MTEDEIISIARQRTLKNKPQYISIEVPELVGESGLRYTLPCIHEGNILEYCNQCSGENKHVRECDIYGKCTRGEVSYKVKSCIRCAIEKETPYRNEFDLEKEKKMKETNNQPTSEQPATPTSSRMTLVSRRRPRGQEEPIRHGPPSSGTTPEKNTLARSCLKTSELQWVCGVTTVPTRRTTTLPKTLESVIKSGFPAPQLFIDVQPDTNGRHNVYLPDLVKEYATDFPFLPMTIHTRNIRTFGNWYLALLELYTRHSYADRFVLFQDDIILSCNVREYLEHCEYPGHGYLNLITYPQNENEKARYQKELIGNGEISTGWYKSNQKGKGAQALVFDRNTVLELLKSEYLHRRIQDEKGWQGIDGAIVTALRIKGYTEYVHSPSLVRHTGETTTMVGPGEHPVSQPLDLSFRGETFDALELIREVKDDSKENCQSGTS